MKQLHRDGLFSWSQFDEARNVDFNGFFWSQDGETNLVFDPMPLTDHDIDHIDTLGGVDWVLLTNADHVRATVSFVERWGARVAAPSDDRERPEFRGLPVALWMSGDEALTFGVQTMAMRGSKTPGELAFLVEKLNAVICGDLVRGQKAGSLNLLPDAKLSSLPEALESVHRLAQLDWLEAVLVGDGQSVFHEGQQRLLELLETRK